MLKMNFWLDGSDTTHNKEHANNVIEFPEFDELEVNRHDRQGCTAFVFHGPAEYATIPVQPPATG